MDLLCHRDDFWGPATAVALSTGSGFAPPSDWGTAWCRFYSDYRLADFNGDGRTDFMCRYVVDPDDPQYEQKVTWGLSTGAGFSRIDLDGWGCVGILGIADFNGDGKSDYYCHEGNGWVWVTLSTGAELQWFTYFSFTDPERFCRYAGSFLPLDVNSDGMTDAVCSYDPDNLGRNKVHLSSGRSMVDQGVWLNGPACTSQELYGDFNADGRVDRVCNAAGAPANDITVRLNTATGFTAPVTWKSGWCEAPLISGDFNGDGKTDILCDVGGSQKVGLAGTLEGKTDVLVRMRTPLGGETEVAYAPATRWVNQSVPTRPGSYVDRPSWYVAPSQPGDRVVPLATPTVRSVTVSDGRGGSSTTTYEYAGGLFDTRERRFLGYGYTKTTFPALANESAGPYAETWFRQDMASSGTPTRSEYRDGTGNLLNATLNQVVTGGNGVTTPYTARLSARWSYEFDGSGTACSTWPCGAAERKYEEYEYDAWGNRTVLRGFGNRDADQDETTTLTDYFPNRTLFILNKPARTAVFHGIGASGTKLKESRLYYDGSADYAKPPSRGLLTNESVWRNTDDKHLWRVIRAPVSSTTGTETS